MTAPSSPPSSEAVSSSSDREPVTLSPARRAGLLVVAALGLTALFFHRVWLTGEMFSARDSLFVYLPVFRAWSERVLAGQLPEWLTLDGMGQPLAGMLVVAPFHPSKLLYLLFPLEVAFSLNILVCFPVALLGGYVLARRWDVPRQGAFLAGLAYAFSGYLVCITNNLCYLMAAATVPWALWATERWLRDRRVGRLLVAGALLALVLYAGDVQAFAMTYGLVLLLSLTGGGATWRRRLGGAAVALSVGVLLAAPQLLASASLLGVSAAGAESLEAAQEYALHPLRLLEPLLGAYLVFPEQPGDLSVALVGRLIPSGFAGLWVDSIHLGPPVLLLAFVGLWTYRSVKQAWVWVGAWLLVLGLSLGASTPLYGAAYALLPPWRVFRYPSKLVPFLALGVVFVAALGWRALVQDGDVARPRLRRAAGALTVGCLLLAVAEGTGQVFTQGLLVPRWPDMPPEVVALLSSRFVTASLMAAVASALCLAATWGMSSAKWGGALLLTSQFLVSLFASEGLYELMTPEVLTTPPPFVEQVLARTPPDAKVPVRVSSHFNIALLQADIPGLDLRQRKSLGAVQTFMPDTPALWGMESIETLLPAASKRVRSLTTELTEWYVVRAPIFSLAYSSHPNIEWAPLEAAGKKLVGADRSMGAVLVSHPEALPRVFLARPRCVDPAADSRPMLAEPTVRSGQVALVECGALASSLATQDTARVPGQVRIERYAAEDLSFDVETERDAVLVVNDAWFPGWSATVDGEPAPILPANVAVRAVPVQAGRHRVVLTYRDAAARAGMAVAGATLLTLLTASVMARRRRGPGLESTA
ncbi:YfhO family protein [Myxococcus sp. K15C18031901]|uniref:YfhO family protein n=1 Tax=Myxococcus dinghuensis TaxID=2906761 RepID=UPI0020A7496E|nr:YfhO family protein [Myxococcus dinghuensis]MCP3102939.1 YfhO family protein [Myxococcus dinghuensis]